MAHRYLEARSRGGAMMSLAPNPTVDSNKLARGCSMIYAEFSFFLWVWVWRTGSNFLASTAEANHRKPAVLAKAGYQLPDRVGLYKWVSTDMSH